MILPHTVIKVTPAETEDARGDTELEYGETADRVDIDGWMQQPGQAFTDREDEGDLDVRRSAWVLFCEDPTITAQDRVEWEGKPGVQFRVDGEPDHLYLASGAYHHTEATLALTEV